MPSKRKKKNLQSIKLISVLIFLILLTLFLIQWNRKQQVKFVRYEAFGIEMPTAYTVHGIDVSRYQKYIGWQQVKEMRVNGLRLDFAFIKATEGTTITDKYYKRNWREARKHKVARGAYHFFVPTHNPAAQARYFISRVKLQPGDMPPVLDAEQAGIFPVNLYRAKIKEWLTIVEAHYGVKPIIYTNADFYKKYMGPEFNQYPLWVAHYYEKKKPRINRPWVFWQHNDRGNVNGINAKVDFNVFNGDSIAFQQMLIQ